MAVGFFFKRSGFVFSMDINKKSTFETAQHPLRPFLPLPIRHSRSRRSRLGHSTELINPLCKTRLRHCGHHSESQPHQTGHRFSYEKYYPPQIRSFSLRTPFPRRAATDAELRPEFSVKSQNLGWKEGRRGRRSARREERRGRQSRKAGAHPRSKKSSG
jgi:hypothetical protein